MQILNHQTFKSLSGCEPNNLILLVARFYAESTLNDSVLAYRLMHFIEFKEGHAAVAQKTIDNIVGYLMEAYYSRPNGRYEMERRCPLLFPPP